MLIWQCFYSLPLFHQLFIYDWSGYIQIAPINVSCVSFTISNPYHTLFLIIVLSSSPTMLTNAYIAESHFPYFQNTLMRCTFTWATFSLGTHALDSPWLDAWLETFDSRILTHHKWKVLAKLCWKCNVIALTKSVNVILKLLDGWLLSLIGLDVFPTSPN